MSPTTAPEEEEGTKWNILIMTLSKIASKQDAIYDGRIMHDGETVLQTAQ